MTTDLVAASNVRLPLVKQIKCWHALKRVIIQINILTPFQNTRRKKKDPFSLERRLLRGHVTAIFKQLEDMCRIRCNFFNLRSLTRTREHVIRT